ARRARLRGGARADPQERRGLGHGDDLLAAEHHQAAGDARLPDPHVRRVPVAARRRRRQASAGELAHELLGPADTMLGATEMLDGIAAARIAQRRSLNEAEGKRLLARFGIPVPRFVTVPDAQAVAGAIDGLRGPFAVKLLSQDILHKSDAGAV